VAISHFPEQINIKSETAHTIIKGPRRPSNPPLHHRLSIGELRARYVRPRHC